MIILIKRVIEHRSSFAVREDENTVAHYEVYHSEKYGYSVRYNCENLQNIVNQEKLSEEKQKGDSLIFELMQKAKGGAYEIDEDL